MYSIFFNLNNFYGIEKKLINALEFCLNAKGQLCAGSFSKIYFCTSGSLMILLDLWWSSPDLICELDQCKNWLITSNLTKIKTKCSNNYPLFLGRTLFIIIFLKLSDWLLTDLATLSHRHCVCTIDAHVQKDSLVQKPICWPSKIEKNIPNETEKKTTNGFSYIFSYVL